MKAILTTTLLLTGITFGLNNTASADHIDDLAHSLERQVRALDAEFARNYRHTPSYRHLMSDTAQMVRLADHIHDLSHDGAGARHLEADVRQLDELFHHIEDLVAGMSHQAHVQPGLRPLHGHGYMHGGFRGPDTRRARMLLASIEETIHHLHDDLQQIIRNQYRPQPVAVYPVQPVYSVQPVYPVRPIQPVYPGYPSRGLDIQIGNGSFSMGIYRP